MLYAEVLLPLPLTSTFTYSISEDMVGRVARGHRVIVPFGRRKFYTGIVVSVGARAPKGYEVKPIDRVLDPRPIVREPQLLFWDWIAEYYLCETGEVYKAALPSGLKPESTTYVALNPDIEPEDYGELSEKDDQILISLKYAERALTIAELERTVGFSNIGPVVAGLMARRIVVVSEKIIERYRQRKVSYVAINADPEDAEAMPKLFATVKGSPKQEKALMALIAMSGFGRNPELTAVTRQELMEKADVSAAIVSVMAKRGLIRVEERKVSRFDPVDDADNAPLPTLSEPQAQALAEIRDSWKSKDITLLRGVTGSGKTEIYINLIAETLEKGKSVLYLVPEIALTTQLTRRLQRVFGSDVIVYHSKHSDPMRIEIWNRILDATKPFVVIGARSSVFLPFESLGLIIIDEEHESSYKQQDPAPRYNARDTALMLARMHGAKSLLGSATPAVETYHKALKGMYGLVELTTRYSSMPLPRVELIDMSAARQKRQLAGVYSGRLRELIGTTLGEGRQAILFMNRRGYAPMALCKQCGYVPKCEHCDVSLTFHRRYNRLVCHYCGTAYELPKTCLACKEPGIEVVGYGTERIEDDIEDFFPEARILRMDLDTTRNRDAYENIIEDFSSHQADILVGTQMVTKGLDFDHVGLVGIINADAMINLPDFRATERAFNMMEQVAGRAGRKERQGIVAVQTNSPSHPLFAHIQTHNYKDYFETEIAEREAYRYPPFTRVIYIYIRHAEEMEVMRIAANYADRLRQRLGDRVAGPDAPSVGRVQNLHIRRIMLKIEITAPMGAVKQMLRDLFVELTNSRLLRGAYVHYDVDPA